MITSVPCQLILSVNMIIEQQLEKDTLTLSTTASSVPALPERFPDSIEVLLLRSTGGLFLHSRRQSNTWHSMK